MKRLLLLVLVGGVCHSGWAVNEKPIKDDTVVIEFGERSKMVIYAESQEDLKDLGEYDINAMIGEINANLDSTDTKPEQLSIEDSTGTKYLKDESENTSSLRYYGDDDERYQSRTDRRDYVRRYERDEADDEEYVVIDRGRSRDRGRTYGAFELEIGLNNWLENGSFPDNDNAAHAVKPLGSWYIGLGGTYTTPVSGPLMLKWGANITWYNWKMEDPSVRITKTDQATTFVPDPTINGDKSKLAATYINLSVMPMLDFKSENDARRRWSRNKYRRRGFRIGAGFYGGYRIDSWTRMKYEINGEGCDDKEKDNFYLNNFRYGIRTQVGYRGIDLFFNYDLNDVFANGRGPELQAISFGFIL